MTRLKGRLQLLLVLTAATAVVGVVATAGAPVMAAATSISDHFGFGPVRSGTPVAASHFSLTSPDLQNNQAFSLSEVANVFGCHGGNQSPRLQWSGAPAGTQSFAVTMFDPYAPTGSGFWHWLVWDIPAGDHSLGATPPAGAVSGTNDAGFTGYLGPCPPPGDITHRYQLTVFALDVPSLGLTPDTHAAVVGFVMRTHILGFGQLIGTFQQPG